MSPSSPTQRLDLAFEQGAGDLEQLLAKTRFRRLTAHLPKPQLGPPDVALWGGLALMTLSILAFGPSSGDEAPAVDEASLIAEAPLAMVTPDPAEPIQASVAEAPPTQVAETAPVVAHEPSTRPTGAVVRADPARRSRAVARKRKRGRRRGR